MTKPKVKRYFLDSTAPSEETKYPVGKIAGDDSHTYNGSHVMHVLVPGEKEGEWVLRCKPHKSGIYSYMGFRRAISCVVCIKLRDK